MRYYYKKDGQTPGPLDIRELVNVADRETLVRAEFGMVEYLPMRETTIEDEYEVLLLEDYNASLPKANPVARPVNTRKVAGTMSIAGGFAILYHIFHVVSTLNNDRNTLNSTPISSYTAIDSNVHVLKGDPLPPSAPTDTLTTAEAMKLINKEAAKTATPCTHL